MSANDRGTSAFRPWRILLGMMAYRPWLYAIDGLLWTGVHASFLVPALFVRDFFDSLDKPGDAGTVALLALAAFVVARFLYVMLSAAVDILHRFTMSTLLDTNAFASLMRLPGAAALPRGPSEALDFLRDDASQLEDAISWALDVLGSAAFTVSAVITLASIDPALTACAFVPLVAVVAVAQAAETRVSRYREEARKASEAVTGAVGETFSSILAVKVAGAEDRATERLSSLLATRRDASVRDGLFNQLLSSIYHNTVGIGTGVILAFLAARPSQAGFSLGDFSLFVFSLAFVTDYTCFWGTFLAHYQQSAVSARRLAELVGDPAGLSLVARSPIVATMRDGLRGILRRPVPSSAAGESRAGRGPSSRVGKTTREKTIELPASDSPADREAAAAPPPRLELLEVAGLRCSFAGGKGVRDVSFSLRPGELLAVTGRVGSGKTTLLRALLGLLPSEGGVFWNGERVDDLERFMAPPRAAYVPQAPSLLSATIRENVLLGLDDDGLAARALSLAAMDRDLQAMPDGLDTAVGPRGLKLSGGQAQRAAVARAFARFPSLLAIDDMSSALDPATEDELWASLATMDRVACVAATHRRATLLRADRVLVLVDGAPVDAGTPEELLARCEEFRALTRA